MRSLVTVLLVMLQLGPLAGAGICMHAAPQPEAKCPMPMPGMDHESGPSHSAPAQDCAQMVVCAPTAPMVPATLQLFGATPPASTEYSSPSTLHPGDPVAPPQPPPIA